MTQPSTATLSAPTNIHMLDLRKSLGQFVERTHYHHLQFRILRKDKPMARLVNEPYMQAIEQLLHENPTLAETLEIRLDTAMMTAIRQGDTDIAAGKVYPIESVLDE